MQQRAPAPETLPATLLAGEGAANIIPERVQLSGTIRAFSAEVFEQLRERVTAVVTSTATMYRCNASVEWSPVSGGAGQPSTA
jgi:metal-dependent amidase/aminoacylase/carboxypeptidase family protein